MKKSNISPKNNNISAKFRIYLRKTAIYRRNSGYIPENIIIYISMLFTKPVIPQACPSLALLCLPSFVLYHDGHRFGYSYKLWQDHFQKALRASLGSLQTI